MIVKCDTIKTLKVSRDEADYINYARFGGGGGEEGEWERGWGVTWHFMMKKEADILYRFSNSCQYE